MVSSSAASRSCSTTFCGLIAPPSVSAVVQREALLPLVDLAPPWLEVLHHRLTDGVTGVHRQQQLADHLAAVAGDAHVRHAHLAELGGVDVDVDHLGLRRERRDLPRHPVVEPGAEVDQQVAPLHGGDRGVVAVHPGHPQRLGVRIGERSPGHERRHHRDARAIGQRPQRLGRVRLEHAAAHVEDGPVRLQR